MASDADATRRPNKASGRATPHKKYLGGRGGSGDDDAIIVPDYRDGQKEERLLGMAKLKTQTKLKIWNLNVFKNAQAEKKK